MVFDQNLAGQVLDCVYTLQEAGCELLELADQDSDRFHALAKDTLTLLEQLEQYGRQFSAEESYIKLHVHCECMKASIRSIVAIHTVDLERCRMKIEYEFFCMARGAYALFYYWAMVYPDPERMARFDAEELVPLTENRYIRRAIERGSYRYKASFIVTGYNKLEYTKLCVESLLKNIPKDLSCELILINHGSSDETKSYFESIHPTKQLDIAINGGDSMLYGYFEGEYLFCISNDIIILDNAIQNMLRCMESDEKIAWLVPSTSNISNFQTVALDYRCEEEMRTCAKMNNISDPMRWEQRVRLCNPIDVRRSALFHTGDGICWQGRSTLFHPIPASCAPFPDDRVSVNLRRCGYKMILAKDAYCHHFGSVTLKNEIKKQQEEQYYLNGRKAVYETYGIDPWGPGFCYDSIFLRRIVGNEQGHIEVLGINCGLGSNSLKLKEQIKEYCRNIDCTLTNITDAERFIQDLRGISDVALEINSIKAFKSFLHERHFQYIIWETPFLTRYKFKSLLRCCLDCLEPSGNLLIKLTEQCEKTTIGNFPHRELGNGWIALVIK